MSLRNSTGNRSSIARHVNAASSRSTLNKSPITSASHCWRASWLKLAASSLSLSISASSAAINVGLSKNGDLVVDASGRGSPSPAWLDALGYAKPREEQIKINVRYMTRQCRRLPEHLHGKFGAIIAACSPDWRFGAILAQEGERWIVSLGGYMGDQSPGARYRLP
jgi:hypothetical protein